MRAKYLRKLKAEIAGHKKGGIGICADRIGISYWQMYRVVNNLSQGTITIWERIIKYYNK